MSRLPSTQSGVGPNKRMGPPLTTGTLCTLHITTGMRDAEGNPLERDFTRIFEILPAVYEVIRPDQWELHAPDANSHDPLQLSFPQVIDRGMLQHVIQIHHADSAETISGHVSIANGERTWRFELEQPWQSGKYEIHVPTNLEDISGNNLIAPLDVPADHNPTTTMPVSSASHYQVISFFIR